MSRMTKAMLEQQAGMLMVQCAQLQAKIREQEDILIARDARITELEGKLVEKDSSINYLDALTDLSATYMPQMLAKIHELEGKLAERPRERSRSPRRSEEIIQKEGRIAYLERIVKMKDELIAIYKSTQQGMMEIASSK